MNQYLLLTSLLDPGGKSLPEGGPMSPTFREALFVLAALAVLSLGLLLWAAFVRRRKRHSSGHSHFVERTATAGEKGDEPRRRKHRRRRRPHRPRNPTLAETGGLPPVRRDEPPASSQQIQTQPP